MEGFFEESDGKLSEKIILRIKKMLNIEA